MRFLWDHKEHIKRSGLLRRYNPTRAPVMKKAMRMPLIREDKQANKIKPRNLKRRVSKYR